MSTPVESAQLILQLFDLRRESLLREARAWFGREVNPISWDELSAVMRGPKSAFLRMVLGYWEMAASLVRFGAIDPAMFRASNGELVFTFAKIEPFLDQLRADRADPGYLGNMEAVVRAMPGAAERMERIRARARTAPTVKPAPRRKAASKRAKH
jgi:hypothetical protein